MKRWIALFLLVLFANDVVIDSFDPSCVAFPKAQACHTCVCSTHYVNEQPKVVHVAFVTEFLPRPEEIPSSRPVVRSLFRPPKTLA